MDESLRKELKQLERRKLKARHAKDLAEEAKLCNVAGELLAEHRLFESAVEEHKMELHLSETMNDTIAVAIAHRKIGECLCECHDFKMALVHQQQYLELSKKSHDLVEEQRAFATIGRTWFQSAVSSTEMLKAQTAFLESLAICDQLQGIVKEKELLEMRARLYLNLGLVYDNLNNKKKGMRYIEKALAIAVNQSLKDTEYRCYFSLGEIKLSDGQPAEALQCFEHARKVAQHQKKKFDEADTLVQMGQALLNLGDFKGGKNILKKCLKTMKHGNYVRELRSSLIKAIKGTRLLEKTQRCQKDEALMKIYEDLGDLFSQVKCYQKAVHYYLKQFELSEKLKKSDPDKAVICVSLAASYSDDKQYDKAKEYYLKELKLRDGDLDEQCETWCNIAQVSDNSGAGYEDIEEAYKNALLCAKKSRNQTKQIRVLKLLSKAQTKFSRGALQEETARELSVLNECKVEEDSEEVEEESQMEEDEERENEDEEGERLIEEEMQFSDKDSDEDEIGTDKTTGRVKRTTSKSINKRNEKGETTLHCAAIRGDYSLAKTSIEKGVSVHSRDYCGWQPLHEACNHGHLKIVELLLENGADINDPGGPHCRGMTPLHDATQNGNVDVVRLLVARGALVTLKNRDSHTPLDIVLNAIAADEEDPDDVDPDVAEVRLELKRILRNSTGSRQTSRPASLPEMKRRAQMNLSDDSEEEPRRSVTREIDQHFPKTNEVSRNSGIVCRKRKNVAFDFSSEDDSDDGRQDEVSKKSDKFAVRNKTKVARVAGNCNCASDYQGLEREREFGSESESLDASEEPWDTSSGMVEVNNGGFAGTEEVLSDPSEELRENSNDQELPSSLSTSDWQEFDLLDVDSSSWNIDEKGSPPLPQRSKTESRKSLKTNRSPVGNLRQTSLENSNANPRSSVMVLDPLTGSTEDESRRSDSPALIPEREYLEGIAASEGWLIDDMPKRASKRKRSGDIRNMLGNSDSRPRVAQGSRPRDRGTNRTKPGRNSPNLRQSRLNNHVVSGRPPQDSPSENVLPVIIEPAEPSNIGVVSVCSKGSEAPMRLRVKVKDRTFLIACPTAATEKKTVQWLAEQATVRYYSVCGLKPVLTLSTAEGASLSPDDHLTDVLSNNEQVIASVETWDLPPLVERYKSACVSADTGVNKKILDLLQSDAHLANVEFPNMALTPVALLPLFRALQCHDQLVRLSLPGNKMGDSGFQHFVSALPCLPNLAVVVLSSNGISHKGLRHLASALTENTKSSQTWCGLNELDMSFNPLKDISASSLATVLRCCPLLQKLNIESCCLTDSTCRQQSVVMEGLSRLRHLNISNNMIMAEGLRSLLSALSCCSLEHLDISYTTSKHDPGLSKSLADYLNKDDCALKELVCQGCFLRDADATAVSLSSAFLTTITKLDLSLNEIGREGAVGLARAIQSSQCPKHLNLSGNVRIPGECLPEFLKPAIRKSLKRLDLSVCHINSPLPVEFETTQEHVHPNCLQFLNLSHNSLEKYDKDKLSKWWNALWGEWSHTCIEPPLAMFTIRESHD